MSTDTSPGLSAAGGDDTWATTSFMVTDVEDGPALLAEHPDQMSRSLARYGELVDEIVGGHGGQVLKSRSEGTSTRAVFYTPRAAVWAAAELQRRLLEEPWPAPIDLRVAVGIHTGVAEFGDGAFYGPTLDKAARVGNLAAGRQVLLSAETAQAQDTVLPPGVSLVDLGPHRLRDLSGAHAVYGLSGPAMITPRAACPYLGLLPFDVVDRDLFFGREGMLAELSERVAEGGLVGLVGSSGSGKTSVLRAGLLAAIGGQRITPGATPPVVPAGDDLLVVDQFEELFTLGAAEEERARFLEALLAREGPVVIGLRADFYGHCAAHPAFAAALAGNHLLLGPMTGEELRAAITGPAEVAHLTVEPELVELLVEAVLGDAGALPLLSHALLATWENRDGRTLTLDGYHSTGGVRRAVAATADRVVAELDDADREVLHRIAVRLVEPRENGQDTCRVTRRDELGPRPDRQVDRVLDALAAARLITVGADSVQLSHEALIREWPSLREWIEADRAGMVLHRHLHDAAATWDDRGRWTEDLYVGAQLASAREWAAGEPEALSPLEQEFLGNSVAFQDRALRQQARSNRRLRLLLSGTAMLLVLAMVALVLAVLSRGEASDAETAAKAEALAATSLVQRAVDPERAILLAAAAVRMKATPRTTYALRAALDASPLADSRTGTALRVLPGRLAFPGEVIGTADGFLTVSWPGSQDVVVRRWAADGTPAGPALTLTATGARPAKNKAAKNKAAKNKAADSNAARTERIRSETDGPLLPRTQPTRTEPTRTEPTRTEPTRSQPEDTEPGRTNPWAVDMAGQAPATRVVAYLTSPDGRYVGVVRQTRGVTNARIEVWDVLERRLVRGVTFDQPRKPLAVPVLSADGRYVARDSDVGDSDVGDSAIGDTAQHHLELLDLEEQTARTLAPTDCAGWAAYEFSRSGRFLAAGTSCGEIAVWDVATGKEIAPPLQLGEGLTQLSISPDEHNLIGAWEDGRITVSPLDGDGPTVTLTASTLGVREARISPDGRLLAGAGLDGTLRIYDGATLTDLRVIPHEDRPVHLAFTPDSTAVITVSRTFQVRMWDACTACGDPQALLDLAEKAVTRELTDDERRQFGMTA